MTRKRLPEILLWMLWPVIGHAQAKSALEQYNQVGDGENYLWMPVLSYQSAGGFYSELRFNYEERNTISFFAGKTFGFEGKKINAEFVPLLGLSAGQFKGASLGLNTDLNYGKLYLSSQMQYSFSLNSQADHFYFNWSEAGVNISDKVFAGLAIQFTRQAGVNDFQRGVVAGYNTGKFSIPVYYFSSGKNNRLLMLGFIYEYSLKGKKGKKENKR